jgi:hypothetical protein
MRSVEALLSTDNGSVGNNRSLPIYESSWPPPRKILSAGEGSNSSHAGSVEPDQSVVGIVMALGGGGGLDASGKGDTATSPVKPDPNSPGWTNRYTHTVLLICLLNVGAVASTVTLLEKQELIRKFLCVNSGIYVVMRPWAGTSLFHGYSAEYP